MKIANQAVGRTSTKALGAVETRDLLKFVISRSFDPNAFGGVKLDKREVCVFVAEVLRQLRLAAILAETPRLTYFIEATYYEAYSAALEKRSHRSPSQLDQFDVA